MKRAREIRRLPLTSSALAALLAALICLTIICIYLYARVTAAAVEGEALKGLQHATEQMASNLNYRLRQTADGARTLLGTVYPTLNSSADLDGQLKEYAEMTRLVNEYLGKYMISKVRLYVPDEKMYSRQRETFFAISTLESDTRISALLKGMRGGLVWQGSHRVRLPMTDIGMTGGETFWAISCICVVSGMRDYNQRVGALFLDISIDQVRAVLSEGESDGWQWLLADAEGAMLVGEDDDRIGERVLSSDALAAMEPLSAGTYVEGGQIIAYAPVEECGWFLVGRMDRSALYRPNTLILNLLIVLIVVTVLVALVIAMMIVHSAMLRDLFAAVNQATSAMNDRADVQAAGRERRGANRLFISAAKLADAAEAVVAQRYQDKLAIAEYQMQALQNQIQPHFLYNTLDVIKWMVADGDLENGVWTINALSKYLRLSINKGPGVVTLAEEIELTRSYLMLMQRRQGNEFQVEWVLEPEAMDAMLPRFTLQPLVENALIHGLIGLDRCDKRLMIRVFLDGELVGVEIEDNGRGMPEDARLKLENAEMVSREGLGVANVMRRLMLFGGEGCRVMIASREGLGTSVTILLPVRRIEQMGQHIENERIPNDREP